MSDNNIIKKDNGYNGQKTESVGLIHTGHRKRIRDLFFSNDCKLTNLFYEHQVLEIILFYTHARGDVNPMAHRMINKFGSLNNVLNADANALIEFGLTENSAMLIKLFNAVHSYSRTLEYGQKLFPNLDSILDFCHDIFKTASTESGCIICLNASKRLVYYEFINEGVENQFSLPRRRIVELAMRYDTNNIVIAHNHPSDSCSPSINDVHCTQSLYDFLHELNIVLLEHVIVTGRGCYAILKEYYKTYSGYQKIESTD